MNFQTHNNFQACHVIAIVVAFKKLSQERSYKMKDFVFITLKLLIFQFYHWKILREEVGGGGKCPPRSSRSYGTVIKRPGILVCNKSTQYH